MADALRQMEPARGLPPTAFEDAASSGVDSNVQLALEQVLKEHPQVGRLVRPLVGRYFTARDVHGCIA